jgi:hypothetical protein
MSCWFLTCGCWFVSRYPYPRLQGSTDQIQAEIFMSRPTGYPSILDLSNPDLWGVVGGEKKSVISLNIITPVRNKVVQRLLTLRLFSWCAYPNYPTPTPTSYM